MKISIITCHDVYNYGASLQAYALQTYLQKLNNEVSIIDYKPRHLFNTYDFWYIPKEDHYYSLANRIFLFKLLYCIRCLPLRFKTWRRIRPFKRFKYKFLSLTKRYNSYEALSLDPPQSDIYVAGSDQIWNMKIGNGLDKAFYLDFGAKSIKRISYAASFAMNEIPKPHQVFLINELSILDSITVREKKGQELLESIGINSEVVIDPVFLLSKKEWDDISVPTKIDKPYLLVYNLHPSNTTLREKAYQIAKKHSLIILNIDAIDPSDFGDKRIKNASPSDFVTLFKNAKYVVTDSFHGTAFSIIFNIPFYVNHIHDNNSRITDLLNMIGMDGYLNSESPNFTFDWNSINNSIEKIIAKSKITLYKMLNSDV